MSKADWDQAMIDTADVRRATGMAGHLAAAIWALGDNSYKTEASRMMRYASGATDRKPSDIDGAIAIVGAAGLALERLPAQAGVVYRGIQSAGAVGFLSGHKVGDVVEYGAFTSASTTRALQSSNDVFFVITSLSGKSIRKFVAPKYRRQDEVILRAGARFRVDLVLLLPNGSTQISLTELPNDYSTAINRNNRFSRDGCVVRLAA